MFRRWNIIGLNIKAFMVLINHDKSCRQLQFTFTLRGDEVKCCTSSSCAFTIHCHLHKIVLGPCKGGSIIAYRIFKSACIAISGAFYRFIENSGEPVSNFQVPKLYRSLLSRFRAHYRVSFFQKRRYRVSLFTPYRALLSTKNRYWLWLTQIGRIQ